MLAASLIRLLQENVFDNRFFDVIEKKFCRYYTSSMPIVLIVGPPRSGTTLVYQLLIKIFEFSYMSNFAAIIPSMPAVMTRLSRPFSKPSPELKKSDYGFIKGLWEPNEGGAIMKKWFCANSKHGGSPLASLAAVQSIMGGPFINKNTFNIGRLKNIISFFPDAIFIHLWRDLLSNVASTYLKAKISKNEKFGYYPKGYSFSSSDNLISREVKRVMQIHNEICDTLKQLNATSIDVSYNELCKNTAGVLNFIDREMGQSGLKVKRKMNEYPKLTQSSKGLDKLKENEILEIKNAIENIEEIVNLSSEVLAKKHLWLGSN